MWLVFQLGCYLGERGLAALASVSVDWSTSPSDVVILFGVATFPTVGCSIILVVTDGPISNKLQCWGS